MKTYQKILISVSAILSCISILLVLFSASSHTGSGIVRGLPVFQNFQLTSPLGYGMVMSDGISTSTHTASSSPTIKSLTATSSITVKTLAAGCLEAASGGLLTSTGVSCAAASSNSFVSTTSVQNLATTTLSTSGISTYEGMEIYYAASTSPSGGFTYNALRMCFNTCTIAAGNTYVTNGNRMTSSNLVVNNEDSSSVGVNMANLAAIMSSNTTGGDFFTARCVVDNNSTTVKSGLCTVIGHSARVTSDSTYTFNFMLTQATAAPITSVSFYMAGTDGPSTFATFATSTRITAKGL